MIEAVARREQKLPEPVIRIESRSIGAPGSAPLAGLRILVVEDEMLVLMDAEDMLSDLGCRSVTGAATVEQALGLVASMVFDAAVLDLNLNGDRSFAIADELAIRGVPFVFATGYGAHGLRAVDAGRPVMTKPYSDKEFGKKILGLFRS